MYNADYSVMFFIIPILNCLILFSVYICVLYIGKSTAERDHEDTIRRRMINVSLLSIFAPVYFKYALNLESNEHLWSSLGFKTCGFQNAILLPLLLTMILFMGPLTTFDYANIGYIIRHKKEYLKEMKLIWLRNYVVGPISEELIFRACMLPILLKVYSPKASIMISSLLFGFAHSHHLLERKKSGMDWSIAIQLSLYQVMFTTIFGTYSSFLFYKTGHIVGIVLMHVFCNIVGFPDFNEICIRSGFRKYFLIFCYITGLVAWTLLLNPLTNPEYFCNTI